VTAAGYDGARERVARAGTGHYERLLAAHGTGALAVGWNSQHAQHARFDSLARVLAGAPARFSVLDYGCGTGALLDWLRERGHECSYVGFDVSEAMAGAAAADHAGEPDAAFTSKASELSPADFVLASGILNLRFDLSEAEWRDYAVSAVDDLRRLAVRGFAFNMLTSHSDADRMRSELHYADPAWWLDHCLRRHSTRVAVLHDYDVWDFTVVVRLDPRPLSPG
jgi:SAM-dependent methyltransferase